MIVNLVLLALGLLIIGDKGSGTPDYTCCVLYMHLVWSKFDSQTDCVQYDLGDNTKVEN